MAERARKRRGAPGATGEAEAGGTGGEKVKLSASSSGSASGTVGLDQLIHGRVRLGIVSTLAVNDALSFNELKDRLATSDGNLSVHARRLEEAGYLECTKSFDGRVPRTEYSLTDEGREALGRYLDHMEALIGRVREP